MMNLRLDRESFFLIIVILVLSQIQACICQPYETCRQPFRCANLGDMKYPFYGNDRQAYCGYPGFELDCQKDVPLITIESVSYRVLDINNNTYSLRVAREDFLTTTCPDPLRNTTLNFDLFSFSSDDRNISLNYGCSLLSPQPQTNATPAFIPFNCSAPYGWSMVSTPEIAVALRSSLGCSSNIFVPVNQTAASVFATTTSSSPIIVLEDALRSGFWIQWSANNRNCQDCEASGGVCGSNQDSESFACYCTNGTCNNSGNGKGSGSSNGFSGMKNLLIVELRHIVEKFALLALIVYIRRRRMHSRCGSSNGTHENVENSVET